MPPQHDGPGHDESEAFLNGWWSSLLNQKEFRQIQVYYKDNANPTCPECYHQASRGWLEAFLFRSAALEILKPRA